MAQIAAQTGLSREQLYRSFSENGNPTLKSLAQARVQLQMPQTSALALESAQVFMRRVTPVDPHQCPCCKPGQLRLVQTLKGCRTLAAPGTQSAQSTTTQQSAGPP